CARSTSKVSRHRFYEVVGAGPLRGHFEAAARRGLTRFVGRERELSELGRALELAMSGHGQVAAIVAEAGTGKSRLVYEFKARLPAECKLLEAYSVSHGKTSAGCSGSKRTPTRSPRWTL